MWKQMEESPSTSLSNLLSGGSSFNSLDSYLSLQSQSTKKNSEGQIQKPGKYLFDKVSYYTKAYLRISAYKSLNYCQKIHM